MNTGDIFELNNAKGWFIQLRHKIECRENSPLSFVAGKWIIGVFQGATAESGIKSHNVRHAIYEISKNDDITFIDNFAFIESEVVFPKYQQLVSVGQDKEELYLCDGYEKIQRIDASEQDKNKMLSFGLSVNSIVTGINRELLYKVSYGRNGWK